MSSARRDFLVELGSEELPPRALRGLEAALAAAMRAGLEKAGLQHGTIESFATPRRLAILVRKLAARQPDQKLRRRGPPVSAAFDAAGLPTRAASAFAASCDTTVAGLQRLDEGKGEFLFYIGTRAGAAVGELMPAIVQHSLESLPIARRMHWGAGVAEFVRPVHWLLMLYGREIMPATLLDVSAGHHTHGHRFHAPRPLFVTVPAAYERILAERGHVIASFERRRQLIQEKVGQLAQQVAGRALLSDALLDEVTALVEWPVPLAGRFEERFLGLPREVLISTLQAHQRYFPVEDLQGRLLPVFITVSNIDSRDPDVVREGNERVVRPRLADASFFWEQDRREPLAARLPGLETMTFQAKLGSLADKTRRVRSLAQAIAAAGIAAPAVAARAAELAKCDLLTAMVGEFPDLQGIMGTYYALADGEPEEVAVAIREHYLPRGAGDDLPATPAGSAVAIADKLDTLAAIFALSGRPSGARDPFGLRRAAIGILRILIERELELDLCTFIDLALEGVRRDMERIRGTASAGATAAKPPGPTPVVDSNATADSDSSAAQIYDFIMERLRAYYLERETTMPGAAAVSTEMFDAVLATRPASPLDFATRLHALRAFLELPEASSLTAVNKRIANILRKAGGIAATQVNVEQLREPAEIRLFDALFGLRDAVTAALAERGYANALGRLAQLRPAIDAFFAEVMVMDEDPRLRANRLALLAQLHALFLGIADLSRLPG